MLYFDDVVVTTSEKSVSSTSHMAEVAMLVKRRSRALGPVQEVHIYHVGRLMRDDAIGKLDATICGPYPRGPRTCGKRSLDC